MKKLFRFCWNIYKKYEEIWNYLIVGGITTVVSYVMFIIPNQVFDINYVASEVISWIVAVIFAYFTNKIFVFKSKGKNKKDTAKEALAFFVARIVTLFIGIFVLYLFIDVMNISEFISKLLQQIVILVLNYIFSKLFIFRNKG